MTKKKKQIPKKSKKVKQNLHKVEDKESSTVKEEPVIHSKKEKDTFKYIIYGILIVIGIVLILAFVPKFMNNESEDNYNYHGFEFIKYEDMYQTQIQIRGQADNLYNLEFRYGPRELLDIPIIGEPKYFLTPDTMYIAFDPLDDNLSSIGVASADIQMNLIRVLQKKLVAAYTQSFGENNSEIPIKNCDNTIAPVIIVRHDPVTLIEQDGNCLIVQGEGMDVTRAANRLMYYLYGIMDKD